VDQRQCEKPVYASGSSGRHAADSRSADGYRVIPLLLRGIEVSALENWFDETPLGVSVELNTGGVSEALPQILAALGERLPDDKQAIQEADARLVAELKLKLRSAGIEDAGEGKRRVKATAQLTYDPADAARPAADSRDFNFIAPLGPIEADDLRWYLEKYYLWPTGVFIERAKRIEQKLPQWGKDLYDAATAAKSGSHDHHVCHRMAERGFRGGPPALQAVVALPDPR